MIYITPELVTVKVNFIHRFEVLGRWTCERNFDKDALLRLLGVVQDILHVHRVGGAELPLHNNDNSQDYLMFSLLAEHFCLH